MGQSSGITVFNESLRYLKSGDLQSVDNIIRHEAKKKAAEELLYFLGATKIGRNALDIYIWRLREEGLSPEPSKALATSIGGIALKGPVGLGAGWDKHGRTLAAWQRLGARHITPGGVAYYPQPGNPMVRLLTFDHMPGDHGTQTSWNKLGFNTHGIRPFLNNLQEQKEKGINIPVIPQVTVNKTMYQADNLRKIPKRIYSTIHELKSVADGFELGLSSGHTKGMRPAQDDSAFIYEVFSRARDAAGEIPLGNKTDGDGGTERLDIQCELATEIGLNWLSLINSTQRSEILAKYGLDKAGGSISGADTDFQQMALESVEYCYNKIGDKVDINGMGGINSAEQGLRIIKKGASAVSVTSAIPHLGLKTFMVIENGLLNLIDRPLVELIGADTKRGVKQAGPG